MSTSNYLKQLRSGSTYPTYRAVVTIFTALGYLTAVGLCASGAFVMSEGLAGQGAVLIVGSVILAFVVVPMEKEVALMLVDLVDSTLEKNSRGLASDSGE